MVLLEHELIIISGGTEGSKNRKYFSDLGLKVFLTTAAAGVILILYIFTIILQLKSLDPETAEGRNGDYRAQVLKGSYFRFLQSK